MISFPDIDKQKIALFKYLATNSVSLGLSWTRIADALKDIHGDLALSIREKYCSTAHGEIIHRVCGNKLPILTSLYNHMLLLSKLPVYCFA